MMHGLGRNEMDALIPCFSNIWYEKEMNFPRLVEEACYDYLTEKIIVKQYYMSQSLYEPDINRSF